MLSRDECKWARGAKSNLLPRYLNKHSVGSVHSKFSSGLNIQVDDVLIYIGCSGTPLSAFGLTIEKEKLVALLKLVRIDDVVVNKGDRFVFYGIDGIMNVDYQELEEVDLTLPLIQCGIHEILETKLYHYLQAIEFENVIGIKFDEKNRKYVDLLLNSNKEDVNVNARIVKFFAGRGKGLTPSGDDILMGFTLTLMMFGKFNSWRQAVAAGVTKAQTTMISVAYLSALLQGYASEHFIRLVKQIDDLEIVQIEKTIKNIQSFGHTSGHDTLFGLFVGLTFLTNQWEG